jgi:hypothetical protein
MKAVQMHRAVIALPHRHVVMVLKLMQVVHNAVKAEVHHGLMVIAASARTLVAAVHPVVHVALYKEYLSN